MIKKVLIVESNAEVAAAAEALLAAAGCLARPVTRPDQAAGAARKCLRLGAADYIAKPFDLETLETSLMVKLLLSS